jgi:uncharacterized repeat protein (TIGR01451 family)
VDADSDGESVSDSDPSSVKMLTPSIDIRKNEEGSDTFDVVEGSNATFEIAVTNDGEVDLVNVTVADTIATACDANIGDLAVGASVTYTCNVTDVHSNFTNTATVNADSDGESVSDEDPSSVNMLTKINLSIVKSFHPTPILQNEAGNFTIAVSNAGPSDAVDVIVNDTVNILLNVTSAIVTFGSGSCTDTDFNPQTVECLPQTPQYYTHHVSEFRFIFVNGHILEGSTDEGPVFLDGVEIPFTGATNDIIFDPPGDDPPFQIHLSCSETFEGGWAEADKKSKNGKSGPHPDVDVNWQIASYSITRFKSDGEFHKSCGGTPVPFEVPNTATATGQDSFGTQIVTSEVVSVEIIGES